PEGGNADHARVGPLDDALDGAALARRVASLEEDAHLQAFVTYPLLELHQLALELLHLLVVGGLGHLPRAVGVRMRHAEMLRPVAARGCRGHSAGRSTSRARLAGATRQK